MGDATPDTEPARSANVADLVTRAVRRDGGHVALIEPGGRTLTWSEVDRLADATARMLAGAGVGRGDRVLLCLPNGIDWCVGLFGVLRAGAVAVPAAADLPEAVFAHVVRDSGAAVALTASQPAEPGAGETGPGEAGAGGTGPGGAEPDRTNGPFAQGGSPWQPRYLRVPTETAMSAADLPRTEGEDLAVLCYTSGTSGVQRGVMLSHRALLANVEQCAAIRPAVVTAADTVFTALPLYHVYGIGPGLLQAAGAAATVVLAERFDPAEALAAIERYRVTTVVGVPPMYAALLGLGGETLRGGMATVRMLTSGGAPLEPALAEGIEEATGLSVYEGYGLTETAPVLTSTVVSGRAKPGSVGRPLPGIELRLVDSDGTEQPEEDEAGDERGGTGLVSVRGANLFSGYWPDGAHGPDAEGWFRTGDVGYLDADGDLHLVDRAGDLIIVNGFNVYPHEVERVLAELDGVAEAAAVGVPDERTGEAVRVFIVPAEGVTLVDDDVRQHCADRLARFKVPRTIEFVSALPHSVTGKLARRRLATEGAG